MLLWAIHLQATEPFYSCKSSVFNECYFVLIQIQSGHIDKVPEGNLQDTPDLVFTKVTEKRNVLNKYAW